MHSQSVMFEGTGRNEIGRAFHIFRGDEPESHDKIAVLSDYAASQVFIPGGISHKPNLYSDDE